MPTPSQTTTSDDLVIEPLSIAGADGFFAYLHDHLRDNGTAETGYFQPMSRDNPVMPAAKLEAFRVGLGVPVPEPGWRRAWVARLPGGEIVGHVDLRARPEPFTSHRCLLGMGVHRDHRRRGLGLRLVEWAASWAREHTALEWLDLEVISTNAAAVALYEKAGFIAAGEICDLFRIDGVALPSKTMVKRLRGGEA